MKRGVLVFILLSGAFGLLFPLSSPSVEAGTCTGGCMWTGSGCVENIISNSCSSCETATVACSQWKNQAQCSLSGSCQCQSLNCGFSEVDSLTCSCCGGTWISSSSNFESGTTPNCCEDDSGEYYKSGACCDGSSDCEDSNTCYSPGATIQSSTLICESSTWYACSSSNVGEARQNKCCSYDGGTYLWAPSSWSENDKQSFCQDGVDNDCDGKIDCADDDCSDSQYCCANTGESCSVNSDCCDSDDLCVGGKCEDTACETCSVGFSGTQYCCENEEGNPPQQCNLLDSFVAI